VFKDDNDGMDERQWQLWKICGGGGLISFREVCEPVEGKSMYVFCAQGRELEPQESD